MTIALWNEEGSWSAVFDARRGTGEHERACRTESPGSERYSWKHTYDGAGNALTAGTSLAATGSDTTSLATPASTVKSYDVASRLASVVNGSGFKTAYARGLTGRETGVRAALISYTGQRFDVVASPDFISAS